MGICEPWLAKPLAPLDDASRAELGAKLLEWGLVARSSQTAVG
jgi:hypothetical protein